MQIPLPKATWDTTGYDQQAGGTHPTGMHPFYYFMFKGSMKNFRDRAPRLEGVASTSYSAKFTCKLQENEVN